MLRTPRTGQQVQARFLAGTPHSATIYIGQQTVTLTDNAEEGSTNLELEGVSFALSKKTSTRMLISPRRPLFSPAAPLSRRLGALAHQGH